MPIIPNFSSTESLSSPNLITFTDTSSGSDNTLTTRHLTIVLSDGTYLVPSGNTGIFIDWPYVNNSITLDLINKSTVATVTCVWLNGTASIYSIPILMEWDLYDYLFLFGLLSTQTGIPTIISDTNYLFNFFKMVSFLWNAESAVLKMNDSYSGQAALDKNKYMMDRQNDFF